MVPLDIMDKLLAKEENNSSNRSCSSSLLLIFFPFSSDIGASLLLGVVLLLSIFSGERDNKVRVIANKEGLIWDANFIICWIDSSLNGPSYHCR